MSSGAKRLFRFNPKQINVKLATFIKLFVVRITAVRNEMSSEWQEKKVSGVKTTKKTRLKNAKSD